MISLVNDIAIDTDDAAKLSVDGTRLNVSLIAAVIEGLGCELICVMIDPLRCNTYADKHSGLEYGTLIRYGGRVSRVMQLHTYYSLPCTVKKIIKVYPPVQFTRYNVYTKTKRNTHEN